MPIITATGSRPLATVNTFWVAANVIFEIRTGETKEVLMLVNDIDDATVFTEQDANKYFNFIAARAANIVWTVERLTIGHNLQRLGRFVIKGVQHV